MRNARVQLMDGRFGHVVSELQEAASGMLHFFVRLDATGETVFASMHEVWFVPEGSALKQRSA